MAGKNERILIEEMNSFGNPEFQPFYINF